MLSAAFRLLGRSRHTAIASLAAIAIGVLGNSAALASVAELFDSVRKNDLGSVQRLLGRGFDVDSTDEKGLSLLMEASRSGHLAMVDYLVKSKAQLNRRNATGESAVMLAAFHGHLKVVQLLHKAGAEIHHSGWSPIHYASFQGHSHVCRYLIESNVAIDDRAPNGATPLMLASREG